MFLLLLSGVRQGPWNVAMNAGLLSDKTVLLGSPIKETGLSTGFMKISHKISFLLLIKLLYGMTVTLGSHFYVRLSTTRVSVPRKHNVNNTNMKLYEKRESALCLLLIPEH